MRNTIVLFCLTALGVAGCSIEQGSQGSVGENQAASIISNNLVIAQAYGAGGNSGATLTNDYVVIFNRGNEAESLSGLRLYYNSTTGTGTGWTAGTPLPAAMVAAGQSYLVQEAAGKGGTTMLTAPDFTDSLSLGGAGGEVALAASTPTADPSSWVDLVGWGGAKLFETASAGTTTATQAVIRDGSGCIDTGDNATDFTVATAAPVNSGAPIASCGLDLGPPDLAKNPDMVVRDAGAYTALLNEVKFNPSGNDNGQEFVELLGTGTLPPHALFLAVSGDTQTGDGKIEYAINLSATAFGSNGLMLIKATTTTFPGVPAATAIVNDPNLESGTLGNFTETAMLVQADNPALFEAGLTIPTTGYTIIDSIAVREPTAMGGTADPIYGSAVLEACKAPTGTVLYPPAGVVRIVGQNSAETAADWYGGQTVGLPTDQYLDDVASCSTATGAPQTYSMSPGLPNNMPTQAPPDLALGPDMAKEQDGGTTSNDDLSGDDLSGSATDDAGPGSSHGKPDLSHASNFPSKGGCSMTNGRTAPTTSLLVLLLLGLPVLLRTRRRT